MRYSLAHRLLLPATWPSCHLAYNIILHVEGIESVPAISHPLHPHQREERRQPTHLRVRTPPQGSGDLHGGEEQESTTPLTQIAVATVAGPQRSGKSFLSNRLLKRMTGFAIGPSTMPCTKGLWIWGEPIEIAEDAVLIIVDTEGLNSVRRRWTMQSGT